MSSVRTTTLFWIDEMKKAAAELPWEDRHFYAVFLAQTYYYVRNATRVLAKAAYRCNHDEEGLHKKLIQGINEEKNHEIMALNDMKEIGYDISQFPENPPTTAYYQTLLAAIDYDGPYALLGYFVSLEGLGAIGADQAFDILFEKYGKKATQFLRVHTRVDKHHFDDGLEFIESLPPTKQTLIEHYVAVSSQLYIGMLKGAVAASRSSKPSSKAA